MAFKSALSPGQTDSHVNAGRRNFAKPKLAYGLAMGGQTDSQVGLQVKFHTSCKKSYISRMMQLGWLSKRCKTCGGLRTNLGSTKINASQRKRVAKGDASRMQVETLRGHALTCESGWPGL